MVVEITQNRGVDVRSRSVLPDGVVVSLPGMGHDRYGRGVSDEQQSRNEQENLLWRKILRGGEIETVITSMHVVLFDSHRA